MKILQIDVNYDYSSTGKITKDLVEGARAFNHTAKACYGRDVENLQSNAIKISSKWEVYTHAALTRITGRTGIFSPFSTKNCIAEIEQFKPDIVHLHELHGYYINIDDIVKYLKEKKIPTVWTFHCEFMYTGKCGYAFDCNGWKSSCGNCPQVREYPASFFIDATREMFLKKKAMFEDFDALKIITPSKWLADRVRESFLGKKSIGVIYNGIDVNTFQPRNTLSLREELGIKTKHVIVSIAPDLLSERKGGKWILELAKRMASEDVTFIMIGVDKFPSTELSNVLMFPRLSDKTLLSQFYSLGDFFLLTSEKETFSLVCAESLACGTPIIGFDAGAPTEVAPEGYGLFVEYGDIDNLQRAVSNGLQNRENFKSRDECMQYAVGMYSKNKMIESYISEYELLLNGCD